MTQEQVKEAADKSWGQDSPEKPKEDRYKVGDAVEYLPHVCHAFTPDENNRYPWVIGMKQNPHYERNPQTGDNEVVEDVVELEEGHLHRTVLPQMGHAPNPREQKSKLIPLRPRKPWKAVVREVYKDGTVDLDVESNVGRGMVTLHYARVHIDESANIPHSCRKAKGSEQ